MSVGSRQSSTILTDSANPRPYTNTDRRLPAFDHKGLHWHELEERTRGRLDPVAWRKHGRSTSDNCTSGGPAPASDDAANDGARRYGEAASTAPARLALRFTSLPLSLQLPTPTAAHIAARSSRCIH